MISRHLCGGFSINTHFLLTTGPPRTSSHMVGRSCGMLPATPPTSSVADLKRCLPCCVPKAPWSKPPSCGLRPTGCQERYQSWSGLCVCHGDAPLVGRSHLESELEQGLNCAEKMPWVSGHNLWAPLPPYHLPADPPSTGGLVAAPTPPPPACPTTPAGRECPGSRSNIHLSPPWGFRGQDPGLHREGRQDWGFWAEGRRYSGVGGFLLMGHGTRR